MDNITKRPNGEASPWMKKYGEEFDGLKLPFGCKVTFVPSPTKGEKPGRREPLTKTGVFGGYIMAPGGKWTGQYYVWEVLDFVGMSLKSDTSHLNIHLSHPHCSTVVKLHDQVITFPLREIYDKVNHSFEEALEVPVSGHLTADGDDGSLTADLPREPSGPQTAGPPIGEFSGHPTAEPPERKFTVEGQEICTAPDGSLFMYDKRGARYPVDATGTRVFLVAQRNALRI